MSGIGSTAQQTQLAHLAVIIPFKNHSYKKTGFQPCIFCGRTIKNHKFKGKTVCIQCLLQIPEIFPYKSNY
jgi:transcriptional pleiotropic regulator of transition state genes